jgi:cytochrome oxidase Cu insertion factor (SCO1/SenC/PrrC family)
MRRPPNAERSGLARAVAVARRLVPLCGWLACAGAALAHEPAGHAAPADTGRSRSFDFDPPAPGSYRLPVIRAAGDGAVLDSAGHPLRLHEALRGRISVLSFIYTRCSDTNGCPAATAALHRVHAASLRDPALGASLGLVSLSFDPTHDTPAVMAQRAATARGGAPWRELTTVSEAELAPILAAYDQVVARRAPGPGQPAQVVGHQLRAYLIDRQLRVRNIYGLEMLDPRLLLADVRTLLAEERAAAH